MPTPIQCPICGRESDFFAEPMGPFCSVRCKRVDLGNWFTEDYKFSEPLTPDHLSDYADRTGPALDQPEEP